MCIRDSSFTDRGYEDERFRDPGYQVAKRLDLPEERENTAGSGSGRGYEKDGWQTGPSQRDSGYQDRSYETVREEKKPWTSKGLKLVSVSYTHLDLPGRGTGRRKGKCGWTGLPWLEGRGRELVLL